MEVDREYVTLRQAGFSENEVHEYFSKGLGDAGFADQEVNAFVTSQRGFYDLLSQQTGASVGPTAAPGVLPAEEPGVWEAAVKGFSHSTTGLRMQLAGSDAFKDQISDEASAALPWHKRLVRDAASVVGDVPDMVFGGAMGAAAGLAAGPGAVVASPLGATAGAFGASFGMRAVLMDQLKNGNIQGYEDLAMRMNHVAYETTKGMATGAATYAGGVAGKALAGAAGGVGATAAGQAVGHFGGEMIGLMGSAGAAEGRVPELEEWTSAATLIIGLRLATAGPGMARKSFNRLFQDVVPKLRDIYQYTGKTPLEVLETAKADPSVVGDLLSQDRRLPERFAQETLERVKTGESVPVEQLQGYLPRSWAKAALLEHSGPEALHTQISRTVEQTLEGKKVERLHWGVVREAEARKLSMDAQMDVPAGLVHSIDPNEVRHTFNHHGNPAAETNRGQLAVEPRDYLQIPEITRNYDTATSIVTDKGLPGLKYVKRIGTTCYVVEEVRTGRKELAFLSMWKMDDAKKGTPPASTPEATTVGPGAADDKSLRSSKDTRFQREVNVPETPQEQQLSLQNMYKRKAPIFSEQTPPAVTSATFRDANMLSDVETVSGLAGTMLNDQPHVAKDTMDVARRAKMTHPSL